MLAQMKNLGIGVLLVVGLVVVVGIGFSVFANSETTTCYGVFASGDAAGRAADAGRAAGFDTDLESLDAETAVTFEIGETGDDAREHVQTFRKIVAREDGELGHPDSGCLEQAPFEH